MSKAQGLSLNIIIVGVLALVVLVILIVIFTGRAKTFTNATSGTQNTYSADNCEIPGTLSTCRSDKSACDNVGGFELANKKCPITKGQFCCSQ